MTEKKTNNSNTNQKLENVKEELKEKVVEVEKKVEAFEEKTDKEVDVLVNKMWFTDRLINASWVKEILNLSFIESSNKRVREHLNTFCKVFGWLWYICGWVFAIYSIVMLFVWIFNIFRGSIGVFLLSIIFLLLSAFVLVVSRWWLKMKKRLPALAIICIIIDLVIMIISIFSPSINFWLYLLCVLISIVVTLYILKNKDMFKN